VVVGLHRGDHRRDWECEWIEQWKAEHWPDEPRSEDDAIARFQAYQPELEEAIKTEDPPSGEYVYLHVVETASEEAAQLPRDILNADRDVRWAPNRETGAWELVE
jgi:hypothetical protein